MPSKKEEEKIIPTPEDVAPTSFVKKGDYTNEPVVLQLKHVKQYFRFKSGDIKYLKAVHDVSFSVHKGEVFGLVGESGCGKTTTGRDILRLYPITSGDIWLDGVRISAGSRWNEKEILWTNRRASARLKKIEEEKKEIEDKLLNEYLETYGGVIKKMSAIKDSPEEAKKALYERYVSETAHYEEEIAAIKKHQKETYDEQMAKIKEIKADNKNVNRNLQAHEVEVVNQKYAELLARQSKGESIPGDEELLKAYNEELAKAKKVTLANKVQMIFQDPIASLNPRMTVRNIIAEGLIINGIRDKAFIDAEVARVLKLVGLVPEHASRYPHEFSGGQRQRIGIARAIIMNPELIVADEPVSALDVSVQAQVINLLNELRNDLGLTIVFIAHNLSVVKYFCDRIAVMYYGNLVELATSDELFKHPLHPYTKSLLSAVPYPDPAIERHRTRIVYNPVKDHDYSQQLPSWREIAPGHFVRCNDEEEERYKKELAG